tara:strand:- start:206 stop:691 length:486 start_codon:yes stop_codon:yes gene_type:complete
MSNVSKEMLLEERSSQIWREKPHRGDSGVPLMKTRGLWNEVDRSFSIREFRGVVVEVVVEVEVGVEEDVVVVPSKASTSSRHLLVMAAMSSSSTSPNVWPWATNANVGTIVTPSFSASSGADASVSVSTGAKVIVGKVCSSKGNMWEITEVCEGCQEAVNI